MKINDLPGKMLGLLHAGTVIPALPLALDRNRRMDEKRQRALIRYYLDAGAGGVAVGVHTTQFEIRLPQHNLYVPLLELACEELDRYESATGKPLVRIAGAIGRTPQADAEAELALKNRFHAVLLSLASFSNASNEELLEHCRSIARLIPLVGFYLQPAVGGRRLDVSFWRDFARIDNVIAIKIAPFNRYQTIDVIRGVAEAGKAGEIALYTGNDDNILIDLVSEYRIPAEGHEARLQMSGGLLGHWAVWTRRAVELLEKVHDRKPGGNLKEMLALAHQITDANAAIFDAANNFAGCIPGIHEVLRRQGLLEGIWTLNENEILSPGQKDEIDRIYKAYPHLNDDDFVAENLDRWMK